MGGAIVKWTRAGKRVGILDLTSGEPTPFGSLEIRAIETQKATHALGISWRENLSLPNRRLESSLEARTRLAEVFRRTQPRWVFGPLPIDAHPDHLAAAELVNAARFWSKLSKTTMAGEPFHPLRIIHYYCVHLKMHSTPTFVLDISNEWSTKKEAIAAYESQFIQGRAQSPSFLEQLEIEARYWGKSINVLYGEPFLTQEPLGLTDWNSVV